MSECRYAGRAASRLVGAGAVDQLGDAAFREAGARVAGDGMDDDAVAARDEAIGHGLVQDDALRDREHVVAALGDRDRDEVVVGEPLGARQDRTGHHDLVVGERAQHAAGRVRRIGEALGELGPGARLDRRGKPRDHDVEELDLLVGERLGVPQEEIGDLPQGGEAPLLRAARDRLLEVGDHLRHHGGASRARLRGGCDHGSRRSLSAATLGRGCDQTVSLFAESPPI